MDKGARIIFDLIDKEAYRQSHNIELIASENFTSEAVRKACGSILTNKYAEGYPGRRYYGGCEFVDQIEQLAIDRCKEIFGVNYANVQPHSGSNANLGVYLALLKPGDKLMGMSLSSGGHLTHGHKVSLTGQWFAPVPYDVDPQTHQLNYDLIYDKAMEEKPRLIIAGGSAYPRIIDFAKFREIADACGAYLMVDMAHFAGLVAGKVYPSPIPYADVVTSTTHKTLRGPRSGIIVTNNEEIAKKIDQAIMPGLQGGPLMHIIAGKAIAFGEVLTPDFKQYIKQVIDNASAFANRLLKNGFQLITGGTDSHLILIDVRNFVESGKVAEQRLAELGITCNMNSIPFDPSPPMKPSGIRVGTPAMTTRGFKEAEFEKLADIMAEALGKGISSTSKEFLQKFIK